MNLAVTCIKCKLHIDQQCAQHFKFIWLIRIAFVIEYGAYSRRDQIYKQREVIGLGVLNSSLYFNVLQMLLELSRFVRI